MSDANLRLSSISRAHTAARHTWDHPDMALLSAASEAAELDRVSAEQLHLVGSVHCLFRPSGSPSKRGHASAAD